MNWIFHPHLCPWTCFYFSNAREKAHFRRKNNGSDSFFFVGTFPRPWYIADKDNPIPHQWPWSTTSWYQYPPKGILLYHWYLEYHFNFLSQIFHHHSPALASPFNSPYHLCIGSPVVPKTNNFGQLGMARVGWSWSTSLWIPVPKPR